MRLTIIMYYLNLDSLEILTVYMIKITKLFNLDMYSFYVSTYIHLFQYMQIKRLNKTIKQNYVKSRKINIFTL